MRGIRWGLALAVVGAMWLVGVTPGRAQEGEGGDAGEASPPESQTAATAQQAREHFQQGMVAYREHRFRDAIRAFETAASLVPSADLWFNIARCYEDLGGGAPHAQERIVNYERAVQNYQRYLRDRVDPPDRSAIEAHIGELERQMEEIRQASASAPTSGTLQIRVNRPGAEVRVDDRSVGQSPLNEPLEISPGRHALRVQLDGYIPFVSEVSVEPGVRTAAFADLSPEARYRAIQGDRIFSYIGFGLAGVALISAVVVGALAASAATPTEGQDLAAVSDGLLGGAIGLGTVGLILWFVEGRSVGTERLTIEDESGDEGEMHQLSTEAASPGAGASAGAEGGGE